MRVANNRPVTRYAYCSLCVFGLNVASLLPISMSKQFVDLAGSVYYAILYRYGWACSRDSRGWSPTLAALTGQEAMHQRVSVLLPGETWFPYLNAVSWHVHPLQGISPDKKPC